MADGQVRCGRCTQVFDANTTLTDELPAEPPRPRRRASDAEPVPEPARPAPEASETSGAAEPAADDGILFLSADWQVDAPGPSPRRRLAWAAAAAGAALLLGGQLVHHYRASLARHELVGNLLVRAYGVFGVEIVPRFDPEGYRIRDWVATAAQDADGRSSLLIRAEIENRGPDPLPQPYIYLALKDRWDAVVASRVFEPGEYLQTNRASESMRAGATTIAELEVVDPGPDAYGFELDVCVRAGADGVRCANDEVFR